MAKQRGGRKSRAQHGKDATGKRAGEPAAADTAGATPGGAAPERIDGLSPAEDAQRQLERDLASGRENPA